MTQVIVITSGKGGVGKTTTTSNIGMALANYDFKTLLIDADLGLRNLDLLLGLENRVIYTGTDVILKNCRLEQALITDKRQPNLTFFPLSSNANANLMTQEEFEILLNKLKPSYDYILIDSPAGIDSGFNLSVCGANKAIVVVTPEIPSIRDADKVIGLLQTKDVKETYLLINRVRIDMINAENMMSVDDVKSILGLPLIGIVPDSENIIIASNRGEPIVLDQDASLPRLAFEHVARRLKGEEFELIDLNEVKSKNIFNKFFSKLKKA